MKRLTQRCVATVALGATAALALSACGSGGSSSSGSSESASAKGDGTITAAVAYENDNFNPISASSALVLGANWHVMEGLYELDMTDFKPYKALAAEDEPTKISDTEYEVKLREGAKYSDGNEVKAADLVNSFEKNTAEGGLYGPMLSFIESMSAKDDQTVSIKLKYPFAALKERLSLVKAFPASATDDDLIHPIGSGPYKYDKIDKSAVDFSKNENYNGDREAKTAKMHWDVIKDDTARSTAVQSGTAQVMEAVPAAMKNTVESGGAKVESVQGFGLPFLMFNTKKAPFDNEKVRQAFFYAIDVDKLIKNAMSGEATAATSFLPENHPNYHKAKNVYTHDADKAKSLLSEAGVSGLSITLLTTDHPWITALAPQIKNDLDAIGINTTIKSEASASLYANNTDVDNPTFDVVLAPGDPSVFGNDPDLLLNWWYGDGTWTQKRTQWKDSEGFTKLHELMQTAVTSTGDTQQQAWNDAFDLLSEQVPLYPLFHKTVATAYFGDQLTNFKPISTTGLYFLGVGSTK
ncbi:MAG: ABC transporter substrate-binding protein [Actinomycetaceae bacterium]|nr:ABC transporter substrate-binding protein [Actinomycetaceae bacterium]